MKKAIRRRNAKTVVFTSPTYYEPSDIDYSDDEDGDEGEPPEMTAGARSDTQELRGEQRQAAVIESLETSGHQQEHDIDDDIQEDPRPDEPEPQTAPIADRARSSEEIFDRHGRTELSPVILEHG